MLLVLRVLGSALNLSAEDDAPPSWTPPPPGPRSDMSPSGGTSTTPVPLDSTHLRAASARVVVVTLRVQPRWRPSERPGPSPGPPTQPLPSAEDDAPPPPAPPPPGQRMTVSPIDRPPPTEAEYTLSVAVAELLDPRITIGLGPRRVAI
ncbi:uncharacterized protein EMH_0031000 [Eimeria mitis]|uniref:Uncharacterized protein n=1 Tax=Eimeria mitis TaxID=44415 RepID=U6JPI5_9EIME|nr:uncharacterized protein EMH_0031000 [Eimeria mitis]CDJ27354.1 hypothetical protein EMH_0031000 [Eimeria mitis]